MIVCSGVIFVVRMPLDTLKDTYKRKAWINLKSTQNIHAYPRISYTVVYKTNKLCMKLCYVSVTLEYLLKMERKMLFYTVHQTISEVCVFSFIYPKAELKSAPHIDHKIRESGPLMFEMYMFRRHLVWTSQPVQFILAVREKHQPCSCFCFLHAALNLKLKWHYFYIVLLWEDSMTRFWSINDQHEFLKTPMQLSCLWICWL